MPTQKQIAANRRNAQKSTGPRTAEGKARSSMNALRSGIDAKSQIIHGETPADLERLKFDYHERFLPDTPEQRMLVDTLIDSEFLLRRFRRVEAQLWEDGMNRQIHQSVLGEAFRRNCDAFARLQRRVDSAQRNYRQALLELERLQAAEAALPDAEPAGEPLATPTMQTPQPEYGFLPQPTATAPTAEPSEAPQPPSDSE